MQDLRKIRAANLRSLFRLVRWFAMGSLSGALVGGIFLTCLLGEWAPHLTRETFEAGATIGLLFGSIGGLIMGIIEWPWPVTERRRTAVQVGKWVGCFCLFIGAIPGAIAGWLAAYLVEALESVSLTSHNRSRR